MIKMNEDNFGDMLNKLALLNESFSYYKTMIKQGWDGEIIYTPIKPYIKG